MSEVETALVTNAVENLPVLEEVPEGATLIAEIDGEFYRVKGEGVGSGLPESGEPFQQLVTDADGAAKWEDKPFGEVNGEVVVAGKIPFTPVTDEVWLRVNPLREINVGQVYHVMLDGERYDVEAYGAESPMFSASNGVFNLLVSYAGAALTMHATQAADSGFVGVEHTIEVLTTEKSVKTIDPKYLPSGGGGGVAFISLQTPTPTVWDAASGQFIPLTKEKFVELFNTGTIRVVTNAFYDGYDPTVPNLSSSEGRGTVVGYWINDTVASVAIVSSSGQGSSGNINAWV